MMCFPFTFGGIVILSLLASPAAAFGFSTSIGRYQSKDGVHGLTTTTTKTQLPIISRSRSSSLLSTSSEFGAITASSSAPRLNPTLIEAAFVRLPWETKHELDSTTKEEINSGERWYNTRQILTRQWVLPRDMSNGSWESYAAAANNGEDKMLKAVPQLLRLGSEEVEASAKTVLKVLKLPPALLRREPLLLTVSPGRLISGFDRLVLAETIIGEMSEGADGSDNEAVLAVTEACKDTTRLLLESATN